LSLLLLNQASNPSEGLGAVDVNLKSNCNPMHEAAKKRFADRELKEVVVTRPLTTTTTNSSPVEKDKGYKGTA